MAFAGYIADRFGRKKALIYSSVPALVSYISLAAGESVGVILFGRFLSGSVIGWVFTCLPMYSGEISDVRIKYRKVGLTLKETFNSYEPI